MCSQIRYLDVTVLIQQYIVQLQVPVDDPPRVQEQQANGDFGRVKPANHSTGSGHQPIRERECRNSRPIAISAA